QRGPLAGGNLRAWHRLRGFLPPFPVCIDGCAGERGGSACDVVTGRSLGRPAVCRCGGCWARWRGDRVLPGEGRRSRRGPCGHGICFLPLLARRLVRGGLRLVCLAGHPPERHLLVVAGPVRAGGGSGG